MHFTAIAIASKNSKLYQFLKRIGIDKLYKICSFESPIAKNSSISVFSNSLVILENDFHFKTNFNFFASKNGVSIRIIGNAHFLNETAGVRKVFKTRNQFEKKVSEILQRRENFFLSSDFCVFGVDDHSVREVFKLMGANFVELGARKAKFIVCKNCFFEGEEKSSFDKSQLVFVENLFKTFCEGNPKLLSTRKLRSPFYKMTFFILGINSKRKELESLIIKNGGKIVNEITKDCNCILAKSIHECKKENLRKGLPILVPEFVPYCIRKGGIILPEEFRKFKLDLEDPKDCWDGENNRVNGISKNENSKSTKRNLLNELEKENEEVFLSLNNLCGQLLERNKIQNYSTLNKEDKIIRENEDKENIKKEHAKPKTKLIFGILEKEESMGKENDLSSAVDNTIKYDPKNDNYLSAAIVVLVGLSTKENRTAIEIIRFGGGSRFPELCEDVTHIVASPKELHFCKDFLKNTDYTSSPPIVKFKWLMDCYSAQILLEPTKYIIKEKVINSLDNDSPLSFKSLNKKLETEKVTKKSETKTENYRVVFSGFSEKYVDFLQKKIIRLGGTVLDKVYSKDREKNCTHLICGNARRSTKVMTALAMGIWILNVNFVLHSSKEDRFLEERKYLFGKDANASEFGKRLFLSLKKNRLTKRKPFGKMRVLYPDSKSRTVKEDLRSLLLAGGAEYFCSDDKNLSDGKETISHIILEEGNQDEEWKRKFGASVLVLKPKELIDLIFD